MAHSRPDPRNARNDGPAAYVGCIAILVAIGIAVVDYLPFLAFQDAAAPGRHGLLSLAVIGLAALLPAPIVMGAAGYAAFKVRGRVNAWARERWWRVPKAEDGFFPSAGDLTFLAALAVALGAGVGVGVLAVRGLDALLP